MFDWENAIALHAMLGNRANLVAKGKSHVFSRVAAGTWGIFSSYDGLSFLNGSLFNEIRTPVYV